MNKKLQDSIVLFEQALDDFFTKRTNKLKFASASKCFEVSFEYTWKYFKREAENAGMEVYSPRDSIKAAAKLKIIDNLELWNQFLNARNLSVHDYLGINDEDFFEITKKFLEELKKIEI